MTARVLRSMMRQMRRALVHRMRNLSRRAIGWSTGLFAMLLLALFVLLHAEANDGSPRRHLDVIAKLTTLKLIDTRWDAAILRSSIDPVAPLDPIVRGPDIAHMQRALDAALAQARDNAPRSKVDELIRAYAEKVDLVIRLQQASTDSQRALAAAMRADAAVGRLVRHAWSDFARRDRLVAAENVVSRVLAQAQQYHQAPSTANREALAASTADLARAHSLPRAIPTALGRLESDIHQLLLLKPLQQRLEARLAALNTGARTDELIETLQGELSGSLVRQDRYRLALIVYSIALLVLFGYLGARGVARYRALERRCREQEDALRVARVSGADDTPVEVIQVRRFRP